MRRIVTLCYLLLLSFPVFAGDPPTALQSYAPVLSWCPSVDATKYRVHMGTTPGTYTVTRDTSDATPVYTFQTLQPGTYYFAVGALDSSGTESTYSNEIAITFAPPPTPGPQITLLLVPYISTTQATIVWQTSEDCSGTGWWSIDQATWKSAKANNLGTTDHLLSVGSLISRTHYYYKVTGDCSGKSIESDVRSFNTK